METKKREKKKDFPFFLSSHLPPRVPLAPFPVNIWKRRDEWGLFRDTKDFFVTTHGEFAFQLVAACKKDEMKRGGNNKASIKLMPDWTGKWSNASIVAPCLSLLEQKILSKLIIQIDRRSSQSRKIEKGSSKATSGCTGQLISFLSFGQGLKKHFTLNPGTW